MIIPKEQILDLENNRSEKDIGTILLFKESATSNWYKAFEWSAYLMKFFPNGLSEKDSLKAIKHEKVDNIQLIQVGLQDTSFPKYLPGINISQYETPNYGSNILKICVDISKYDNKEISFLTYQLILNNWKQEIPISANKKQPTKADNIYNNPMSVLSITKDFLRYQTDGKSIEELIQFINTTKNRYLDVLI